MTKPRSRIRKMAQTGKVLSFERSNWSAKYLNLQVLLCAREDSNLRPAD
jgi:hypothetical protein